MKAIILAAGRGSRMGHLTDEQPKCLTKVAGKPLIEHQITALTEARIKDIALVTGYKAEILSPYGIKHFHNHQWGTTNIVHSLLCARPWLEENDCIISYADIFYGTQIVKDLIACKEKICVAYDPHWLDLWSKRFENPLDDAETFRINDEGCITEIGQKPRTIEEIQGQYMGLLKFRKSFWKKLPAFDIPEKMDMTSFLRKLVNCGDSIKGIANKEAWGEVDSERDLGFMNALTLVPKED